MNSNRSSPKLVWLPSCWGQSGVGGFRSAWLPPKMFALLAPFYPAYLHVKSFVCLKALFSVLFSLYGIFVFLA